MNSGGQDNITEVKDVENEPVEGEQEQQEEQEVERQSSAPNIEEIIDRKFGELRGEISGVERRVGEKVEGLRKQEEEESITENFDATDPNDIQRLVRVEASKITEKALKESDSNRRLETQRQASDDEAIGRFPWLKDTKTREYQAAHALWQKKFGNTSGPIDALMQVALEADFQFRKEAGVKDDDNDVRRSKGSYSAAGGSPANVGEVRTTLTKNQKSLCEEMGISEKEYKASVARRDARGPSKR